MEDRFKLLMEKFNPTPCYDWECETFESEGQNLIAEVEKIKPVVFSKPSSFVDWLKTFSEDEEVVDEIEDEEFDDVDDV